jgi:hypothetical protein
MPPNTENQITFHGEVSNKKPAPYSSIQFPVTICHYTYYSTNTLIATSHYEIYAHKYKTE